MATAFDSPTSSPAGAPFHDDPFLSFADGPPSARPTSTSLGAAATTSWPPPTPTRSATTPPPRTPSVQSLDPDGVDLEAAASGLVPLAGRRLGRCWLHAPLVPLLLLLHEVISSVPEGIFSRMART